MTDSPQRSPTPMGNPVQALVGEFLEEKEREAREMSAIGRVSRARTLMAVLLSIACAAAWILPSFYEAPAYSPSPARVGASARMTVFLAAQRVLAWQKANGSLPSDLIQAGADSAGLTYVRSTDSLFEIHAAAGGEKVTFRSSMTPASFLGETFQVLGSGQ